MSAMAFITLCGEPKTSNPSSIARAVFLCPDNARPCAISGLVLQVNIISVRPEEFVSKCMPNLRSFSFLA